MCLVLSMFDLAADACRSSSHMYAEVKAKEIWGKRKCRLLISLLKIPIDAAGEVQ